MKLVCSVFVGNRLQPTFAVNSKRKHSRSTIAVCKTPKSKEYCVLLFSGENKSGTKYNLKNNISRILTKFLSEGKVTIQFKEPQHDLCIQADSIQLKSFLHILKLILENKMDDKQVTLSSVGVMPVNHKNIAPKTLKIKNRSEYPVKGLPRTLEVLHINDINKFSVNKGIYQLNKLRILDLSNNCIETLPVEIKNMPCLIELNLSQNSLGKTAENKWNWMGGYLSKNLKILNLSDNKLTFVPLQIKNLLALVSLNVSKNELKELPSGIGCLQNLMIFKASKNSLTFLPGNMKNLRLNELDLSENQFTLDNLNNNDNFSSKPLPVSSLKELSAQSFLTLKIPYEPHMMPLTVCNYLDYAKFCICSKACFETYFKRKFLLWLSSIAEVVCVSSNGITDVPVEYYFCSLKCSRNVSRRRPIRLPRLV